MAYTATYESTDLGTIIVDVLGYFFSALARNAALLVILIIILVILGYTTGIFSKLFGLFGKLGR